MKFILGAFAFAVTTGFASAQLGQPPSPSQFQTCVGPCETVAIFQEARLCEQYRLVYASYCRWDVARTTGRLECQVNQRYFEQTKCI